MPSGTVLGLTAKLGVDTDTKQVEKETKRLTDKLEDAAEAEMTADVGTLKSDLIQSIEEATNEADWLPGSLDLGESVDAQFDDRGRGRVTRQLQALGQNAPSRMGAPPGQRSGGGGAGGLIGEAFAGMKGAGGKFLKVGLAGAVGAGILTKLGGLADSAPRMEKNLSMLAKAVRLFARPFFDYIAKWMEGDITALLEYAANFNKWYSEGNLPVAIMKSAKDIASRGGDAGPLETAGRVGGLLAGVGAGAYAGAKGGAMLGGAAGSVLGPGGTAAGAIIGGGLGAVAGGILGVKAGGALGSLGDDLLEWLKDQWPGWPSIPDITWVGPIIPPFEKEWVGDIIDIFPGWIKSSPGVIDPFPGWGEWLNPLNWPVPSVNDVKTAIGNHIPDLNWNVPSARDVGTYVKNSVPDLNWNVPSWSDMKGWVTAKIASLDWIVPSWTEMKTWVSDHINPLDWNIPSAGDVLSGIEDNIPTLTWPDISKDDIVNAVTGGSNSDDGDDPPHRGNDPDSPNNSDNTTDTSRGDIDDDDTTGYDDHSNRGNVDDDDTAGYDDVDDGSSGDTSGTGNDKNTGRGNDQGGHATLAEGGIVTSPTSAVIGEGQDDEAVIPLSQLSGMLDRERELATRGAQTTPRGGPSGPSDEQVRRIVDAIEDLHREIKRLDPQTVVNLDGRKMTDVEQRARQRYSTSQVVDR